MTNKPEGIVFDVSGALDFSQEVIIQLRTEDPNDDSFTEIHPLDLMWKISFPHTGSIVRTEFSRLVKRVPHISDKTESVPNRFTRVWYKCQQYYRHSHWYYTKQTEITNLTLEKAIKVIKKYKMDILPGSIHPFIRF